MEISRGLVLYSVSDNFKCLEQYRWFKDSIVQNYNPATIKYFADDQTYKNTATSFKKVAVPTYLQELKAFRRRASELVKKVKYGKAK